MNDKKIKVGEYVRTENGEIFIVDEISWYEKEELYFYDSPKNCGGCWSDQVKKHSSNIIDLIEVGDYVNGYEVRGKTKAQGGYVQVDYYMYSKQLGEGSFLTFTKEDIESIVTKEQFRNIEYRVEE